MEETNSTLYHLICVHVDVRFLIISSLSLSLSLPFSLSLSSYTLKHMKNHCSQNTPHTHTHPHAKHIIVHAHTSFTANTWATTSSSTHTHVHTQKKKISGVCMFILTLSCAFLEDINSQDISLTSDKAILKLLLRSVWIICKYVHSTLPPVTRC